MGRTTLDTQPLRRRAPRGLFAAALAAVLLVPLLVASDHADPIRLDRLEGGITDLFAFPTVNGSRKTSPGEGDQLVVIFCVRRSLSTSPPYEGLDQFTYTISMDLHSQPEFRKGDPNLARYGGTVKAPEQIDADFTITFRLDDDVNIRERAIRIREANEWKEPKMAGRIRWYAGVRDDPFIFPQFFGTNVVAVAMSIPFVCFPAGQRDWLLWGTSSRHGVQIDHVGRSQRTQLPRFDSLNTVHPKDHVANLRKRQQDPGLKEDFLRTRIAPEFALRPYDFEPDVMFFTRRPEFEAKYPNGRQLEDDVAKLTCEQGDCQLFELSQAHPRSVSFPAGRPAENDKSFSDTFPYLADPHPDSEPRQPPELTAKNRMLVTVLIIVIAAVFLFPWVLYFWTLRRFRRVARQLGALQTGPAAPPTAPSSQPSPPAPHPIP